MAKSVVCVWLSKCTYYLDLLSLRLLSDLEAALFFFRAVAGEAGCLWEAGA